MQAGVRWKGKTAGQRMHAEVLRRKTKPATRWDRKTTETRSPQGVARSAAPVRWATPGKHLLAGAAMLKHASTS